MGYEDKKFNKTIPDGFQILYAEVETAGIFKKLVASKMFLDGSSQSIELEAEANNKHDKNAIIVNAEFDKRYLLFFKFRGATPVGYVPKDIAKELVEQNLLGKVQTRLKYIGLGDRGGKITFDILISKADMKKLKNEIEEQEKVSPATKQQKDMLKYYNHKIKRGLTIVQANELIKELPQSQQDEWDDIVFLYEDIIDKENMVDYDIKKISFTLYLEIIKEHTGKVEDLSDYDIYEIALVKKPELERK